MVKHERNEALKFNGVNDKVMYDPEVKTHNVEKMQYLKTKKDFYGKYMNKHMEGSVQ